MITVLSHGKYYDKESKYYRFHCSCGCDFICSKWDLVHDKSDMYVDKDKAYILCPDCKERNYISTTNYILPVGVNSKIVFNSKLVETLTQEEYNELAGIKEEKEENT